jgi:hypothetical protein
MLEVVTHGEAMSRQLVQPEEAVALGRSGRARERLPPERRVAIENERSGTGHARRR